MYIYVKRRDFEVQLSILRQNILVDVSTNLLRSCAARITASDYNIKLVVRNATRAESGTYTLTATNENGTDTADVLVTILGTSGSRGDGGRHSAGNRGDRDQHSARLLYVHTYLPGLDMQLLIVRFAECKA